MQFFNNFDAWPLTIMVLAHTPSAARCIIKYYYNFLKSKEFDFSVWLAFQGTYQGVAVNIL